MASKQKLKILWAIDPFESESETRTHVVAALKQLSTYHPVSIEPTYVLSPSELNLNFAFSSTSTKEYKDTAKKILALYLEKTQIPQVLPPKILLENKPSLRQSVRTILDYAKSSRFNLIALGTHSRKGLSRFFLGSFAETMILNSKVPLLVIGPQTLSHQMDHILFATDLGKNSAKLFEKVLDLAKSLDAKITLFHSIPHPVEAVVQTGVYLLGGGWLTWPNFISQEEDKKRKIAERYQEIARKNDIELQIIIDTTPSSTSSLILKEANEKSASIIAMAAESGALKAAIAGSTTRQVVREAPCPVWIMRP